MSDGVLGCAPTDLFRLLLAPALVHELQEGVVGLRLRVKVRQVIVLRVMRLERTHGQRGARPPRSNFATFGLFVLVCGDSAEATGGLVTLDGGDRLFDIGLIHVVEPAKEGEAWDLLPSVKVQHLIPL